MSLSIRFYLLIIISNLVFFTLSTSIKKKRKLKRRNVKRRNVQYNFVFGSKISFESANYPNHFMRHRNYEIWLDKRDDSDLYKNDASFIVRPALNGKEGYISFESVNYPGRFIRHSGYVLWIHQSDESQLFKDDASFNVKASRNGKEGFFSFESSNYPDHFIRHQGYRCKISPTENSDLYNHDASWKFVTSLDNNPVSKKKIKLLKSKLF